LHQTRKLLAYEKRKLRNLSRQDKAVRTAARALMRRAGLDHFERQVRDIISQTLKTQRRRHWLERRRALLSRKFRVSAETVLKTSLPEVSTSDGAAGNHDAGAGPESEKVHTQDQQDDPTDSGEDLADLQAEYNDDFRKLMRTHHRFYGRDSDDFMRKLLGYKYEKRRVLGAHFEAQAQHLEDSFAIQYLEDNVAISKSVLAGKRTQFGLKHLLTLFPFILTGS
jgi:hypothetical protein